MVQLKLTLEESYHLVLKYVIFASMSSFCPQGPEPALNSNSGGAAKPPLLNSFELDRCLDR